MTEQAKNLLIAARSDGRPQPLLIGAAARNHKSKVLGLAQPL